MNKRVLEEQFYQRKDTLTLCEELLGQLLCTTIEGNITGGYITEVEAYLGAEDRACHAYNNRRTKRTEVMFRKGGVCYVYLCYGMHHLLNIVTHEENVPHAILIRSIHPTIGLEMMQKRHPRLFHRPQMLIEGPGNVTKALGIDRNFNGISLCCEKIWIEEIESRNKKIITTPRIGIEYAGADALHPWRFVLSNPP